MLVSAMTLGASLASAQRDQPDSFLNQQRAIEELTRKERDALQPVSDRVEFDYGGHYSLFFSLFDDGVNSSRTVRRHDLRLWGRLSLERGAHEFYARSRLSFIDFNHGDGFGDDDDTEGLNLERGYYKFDLAKAMQAYTGSGLDYNVEFKIGRDFTQFGTGYVLATPLDQVWLRTSYQDLALTWLAGKTVGSSQDFDITRDVDRTRRTFFGLEAEYHGFERHEPFAYVLWQRDHNSDDPPAFLQKFDYDSFYVGLGSTGEIVANLHYASEWAFETGHGYGNRRFLDKNRLNAWAWDNQLEYLFDAPGKPRVSVEHMFASGDPDRLLSPTDSIGGNSVGFTDSSFIGFGFRDTGLSFAPRLSNVHVWRAGGSYFPFEGDDTLDRLQLGTNWFLYHKNRASGAVSDPTADRGSGYLGWEMDYFANWQMTNDFSWTARYGVFFPGQAFDDRTTRTYFLVGFIWNF